jgi:hypothetical protein
MSTTQMDLEAHRPHEGATRAALGTVLGTIRLALADRALLWVALLAGIAFTAWALARPDVPRLCGVAGYVVLIFWPLLFIQHQRRS